MSEEQKLDHTKAPIIDAIEGFHTEGFVPFCVPGHKRDMDIDELMAAKLGNTMYRNDIAELLGIDDRKQTEEVRTKAEELAADAFGAKQSFYSIGVLP